jgi:hypothetical protein
MGTHWKMRNAYKNSVEKPEGWRRRRKNGRNGKINLKWILRKEGWWVLTGLFWLRIGTCGGLL